MMNGPRIALITGAGSGVGRATAKTMWEAGYSLILAGRREDKLRETQSEAGVGEDRALIAPTDVADRRAVSELFAAAVERFGRLDVLFNNAGVNAQRTVIEEYDEDDWQRVMQINVSGTFWCTQEAIKLMKAQDPPGGRIINNGSLSAHMPRPQSAPYVASKHAVSGLTKCAALEGRAFNIACGQIDIGNASTDMTSHMQAGTMQADGSIRDEPTINVQHVADAVLYMANLPLNANVLSLTVMATQMPFVGRG
ncbi:MAG: SDR family NAD(P)-dependent oxidoreductase [Chloroflexi bacterium]|nr:SDR family NAD(P)-dependent oxidoreductase [Chloroflexota bacterium]